MLILFVDDQMSLKVEDEMTMYDYHKKYEMYVPCVRNMLMNFC